MVTFDDGVALLPPIAIAVPIIVASVLLAIGRRLFTFARQLGG